MSFPQTIRVVRDKEPENIYYVGCIAYDILFQILVKILDSHS